MDSYLKLSYTFAENEKFDLQGLPEGWGCAVIAWAKGYYWLVPRLGFRSGLVEWTFWADQQPVFWQILSPTPAVGELLQVAVEETSCYLREESHEALCGCSIFWNGSGYLHFGVK
jgi:hypothetical protein